MKLHLLQIFYEKGIIQFLPRKKSEHKMHCNTVSWNISLAQYVVWMTIVLEIKQASFSVQFLTERRERKEKKRKGSRKCSIPASSQVPLPGQPDEEVAGFLRQFINSKLKCNS